MYRRKTPASRGQVNHVTDVFHPAWRRAYVQGAKSSQDRNPGSQSGDGARSLTGWHSALRAGSCTPAPSTPASEATTLALTDTDVHTSRQYAITMFAQRKTVRSYQDCSASSSEVAYPCSHSLIYASDDSRTETSRRLIPRRPRRLRVNDVARPQMSPRSTPALAQIFRTSSSRSCTRR